MCHRLDYSKTKTNFLFPIKQSNIWLSLFSSFSYCCYLIFFYLWPQISKSNVMSYICGNFNHQMKHWELKWHKSYSSCSEKFNGLLKMLMVLSCSDYEQREYDFMNFKNRGTIEGWRWNIFIELTILLKM